MNDNVVHSPVKSSRLSILAALLLLAPAAAQAQTGSYGMTAASGTFTLMTDGQPVGITSGFVGNTATTGRTINLGFPFVFYGQTYTSVYVNTLGQIVFGGSSTAVKPAATILGNTAAPNNWVSGWWPDRAFIFQTDADFTYKITGNPGERVATFQWHNWGELWSGRVDGPRTMQMSLREATRAVEVKYGPLQNTASIEYAIAGAEDGSGANPVSFLSCNLNGSSSRGCRDDQWPAVGTTINMQWFTQQADLYGAVEVTGVRPTTVNGLATLDVDLKVTVYNLGNTPANNVVFDIYQSSDDIIDPASDNKVGAHGSPLTLAAKGTAVVNTTVSVARPQTGSKLFMGIELDPIGAVQDAHRSNNRSASAPFVVGVDLYAVSVTGPATAGLGAAVTLNATVGNAGSDPVTATFGIYMSADRVIDPATDIKVGETQITLGGFERKTVSIAGQVPRNFATTSNELHWGVYADPGKQQQEPSRADNGASSVAKVTIVLPDLTAENLRLNRTEYYFGERASFTAELQNIGEGDALNATVWLVLSDNASITLTDHAIALVDNLNIPRKGKVTVQFDDVYLPLYPDGGSVPYATGKYFFGVILDPMRQIPEQSETNNGIAFQPEVTVRQPAPDFHAVRVDGPPVSAGGELVPVSRLIRNIGNRGNDVAGKAYRYQYFLSENEIISVQDRLLPLVVDGVEKTFGTGRLAAGAEDRGVDQVRLPKNLPAGDYFLGMVVDPTNEIDELREDNNIVASGALVRVVGTGLDIVTQWLPDATERVGYLRQLVARGGTGSYQWRVVPGYGQLPQGMSLSADGILSGTPTRAGVADFVVEVTSGNLSSMARLLLRVFTPTGTLQLVTRTLPLGVEGRPYGFDGSTGASGVTLVGSGGVPPYKWALVGTSTLPTGVSFNNGVLAGTPATDSTGDYNVDVQLIDATGAQVFDRLALKVVKGQTLAFDTRTMPPDGLAGTTYTLALPMVNARPPIKVAVTQGGAPEGLSLSTGNDRVFLLGTPVRPGAYPFVLTATDASGNQASRALVIHIAPGTLELSVDKGKLPDATPGEAYDSFVKSNAKSKSVYSLVGGSLPPGLRLDDTGAIRGTVPVGTPGRTWDFLIEVRDQAGATGMAPFSIFVVPPAYEPPPAQQGCSASGSAGAFPGAVLALAALLRRNRRRSVSNHSA